MYVTEMLNGVVNKNCLSWFTTGCSSRSYCGYFIQRCLTKLVFNERPIYGFLSRTAYLIVNNNVPGIVGTWARMRSVRSKFREYSNILPTATKYGRNIENTFVFTGIIIWVNNYAQRASWLIIGHTATSRLRSHASVRVDRRAMASSLRVAVLLCHDCVDARSNPSIHRWRRITMRGCDARRRFSRVTARSVIDGVIRELRRYRDKRSHACYRKTRERMRALKILSY